MKVKKISALLMAAAVLAGSVPAQAVFAEEAAQEAAETTAETKVPKIYFPVYWRRNELSAGADYKLLSECH